MAATNNPLEKSFTSSPSPVSKKEYPIAGIITAVYGLEELTGVNDVSCLWLLHPRLSKREHMEPIAHGMIAEWNSRRQQSQSKQGLICVSFDQRNHGTRLVDDVANISWRDGNPRHAQDMFSVYHGTASDTSLLINYLPAYIFPRDEHNITSHMVLGVSLGGHAAWQCLLHDNRINTAVVVIGCADYVRVMTHRAEKTKLETWLSTKPPGSKFLGSKDFPKALMEAVDKWDPSGLLMSEMIGPDEKDYQRQPSEREKKRLMPLMRDHLKGKRVFNLAGGVDKLVPYSCSEPFLLWLKNAIAPGGWFSNQGVMLKDKVYDGSGHDMTPDMMKDSIEYIMEIMATAESRASKI